MRIKVVTPKIGSGILAYSPLPVMRVSGTEDGFNLNHREAEEVPYEQVRMFAVFSTTQGGQQSYHLLLFLHEHRRPFMVDGYKIHYGDFAIEHSETMLPHLRAFATLICRGNPAVGIDRGTFDFLGGRPPQHLDRDAVSLATALGEILKTVDELSEDRG